MLLAVIVSTWLVLERPAIILPQYNLKLCQPVSCNTMHTTPSVPAIKWGVDNESKAKDQYCEIMSTEFTKISDMLWKCRPCLIIWLPIYCCFTRPVQEFSPNYWRSTEWPTILFEPKASTQKHKFYYKILYTHSFLLPMLLLFGLLHVHL